MILKRLINDQKNHFKLNDLQLEMKKQVEEKVDTGLYTFEDVQCPVCESDTSDILGEKDRYGLYYSSQICKGCGLIYTSPRMDQESYNIFYNSEYRKLYGGEETASEDFFMNQYTRGKDIYDIVSPYLEKQNPYVLEVGCGAGGILKYFQEKGAKVKGIDLGDEYVNFGKTTKGLDLETNSLSELKLEQKPDVIIYSHVIEHILDLPKELETIFHTCDNNTIIYIEVPGIKYIHRTYQMDILNYLQNAHTYNFSLATLKNLFLKNGFQMLHGDELVRAVFKRTNEKNSTIDNDYYSVVSYIKRQESFKALYPVSPINIYRTLKRILK